MLYLQNREIILIAGWPESPQKLAGCASPLRPCRRRALLLQYSVCLHGCRTSDTRRLALALRPQKRRHARLRPVQTRTTPPAEARAATNWPISPPASPVCTGRTQARMVRPSLLLAYGSHCTTAAVAASSVRVERGYGCGEVASSSRMVSWVAPRCGRRIVMLRQWGACCAAAVKSACRLARCGVGPGSLPSPVRSCRSIAGLPSVRDGRLAPASGGASATRGAGAFRRLSVTASRPSAKLGGRGGGTLPVRV